MTILVVGYRWMHVPFVFEPVNIACRQTRARMHTVAHAKRPFHPRKLYVYPPLQQALQRLKGLSGGHCGRKLSFARGLAGHR